MWENDQVPGDDCTQKIPYLKCQEKFEKIYIIPIPGIIDRFYYLHLIYRLFKMKLTHDFSLIKFSFNFFDRMVQ